MKKIKIPIEISARHVHLSESDLHVLFGEGYNLKVFKEISQPSQFAAEESLEVVGSKGAIKSIRVVGPLRSETQVELAVTDCINLGIEPKVFISGDLAGSPGGITLKGPAGQVKLLKGVIVAARHLHISPEQAASFGLKHLDRVKVKIDGIRGLIFGNVVVRSRDGIDDLALHLDTDEVNAAGINNGDIGWLVE